MQNLKPWILSLPPWWSRNDMEDSLLLSPITNSPVTFLYGLADEKTSSVLPTLPDTSTKVEIILINESFYQEKID